MDKMTDEELARVIVEYCKNGDQSTPIAEIVKWATELLSESRKGMFTRREIIDFAHFMDAHEELTSDEAFDQYLTERKGRG